MKYQRLAYVALTFDVRNSGTRFWAEVPFGQDEVVAGQWPWDSRGVVPVPNAEVFLRGKIDRVDWGSDEKLLQVTDYKTGVAPRNARGIVLGGGTEIQRVIYAIAARALAPTACDIAARLVYLGGDDVREYKLPNIDLAIRTIASQIINVRNVLRRGQSLPHTRDREEEVEHAFDLALPAEIETYIERKRDAFREGLGGELVRFWRLT